MRVAAFALALFLTQRRGPRRPVTSVLFDYDEPQPPVGGDCDAIAAAIGPEATWYGEFAGNHVDDFTDCEVGLFRARLLQVEYACRAFLAERR